LIKGASSATVFLQILLIVLSFSYLTSARAEVTSLSPIDDAYVSSLYPYINRGSDKLLLANYRSRDVDVKILVYIKFDLSNIPSNVEITSAKLELYSMSLTIPSQISIYYCPYNAWNEREITYANAPEYNPTSTSSAYVSGANTWYSWDLMSDVRNARGGKLSEILQISFSSEPNHVSFYSNEASDSSYRPRLKIEYVSHKVSTSETTSFGTEEKTQITPLPPPGIIGFPIFWILVPIIALCVFAIGALYFTRSRRGVPPSPRRRVKPMPPSPPQVPKTPLAMPEVPPTPKEKKLPEVKITPAESLMSLDDKVYLYILDHEGVISWTQASRDLSVSIEELKDSIERLKQAKRIE